jgi:hypothetical protein
MTDAAKRHLKTAVGVCFLTAAILLAWIVLDMFNALNR